jgi:hypothetical protein
MSKDEEVIMNGVQMIQILEQFIRKDEPVEGQVKVLRVPDYKSVYVEQIGEIGRSIILSEYKVDGKTYRAGYSLRSDTVFVSHTSQV